LTECSHLILIFVQKNADGHCMTKLEKEKLDSAAFCFQQFFCSFDKKIWKKFGIFFS